MTTPDATRATADDGRGTTPDHRPRPPRGPGWLLIGFLVAVVIGIGEVWLLITVGRAIGVLPLLGILLVQALLGGWLMRREGARARASLAETLRSQRMPSGELADAALVVLGGVLLMLPGFIGDLIGLVFLLPFTRPLARRAMTAAVARGARRRYGIDLRVARARMDPGNTIAGETVDDPATAGPYGSAAPSADEPATHDTADDPRVIRGEVER